MSIDRYFAPGGPLEQALREYGFEYAPRRVQRQLAEHVARCFAAGADSRGAPPDVLPAEAGTGTGKSLGTLIALADRVAQHRLAGETEPRGGLSTYTNALHRQMVEKDAPIAMRAVAIATGVELTWASYHGARQFVSLNALRNLRTEAEKRVASGRSRGQQDAIRIARIDAIMPAADAGDEPGESLLFSDIKERLGIEPHKPLLDGVRDEDIAGDYREVVEYPEYGWMRDACRTADIVFGSHAAFLLNGFRWFSMIENVQPIRYLVFDEAHRIVDAADTVYGRSLSLHRLGRLLEAVMEHGIVDQAAVRPVLAQIRKAIDNLAPLTPKEDGGVVLVNERLSNGTICREFIERSCGLKSLRTTVSRLAGAIDHRRMPTAPGARAAALDLLTTADDLGDIADAFSGRNPYRMIGGASWSPVQNRPSLVTTTVSPGRRVTRYLRRYPGDETPGAAAAAHLWGCVFMSATMPPPKELGLFARNEKDPEPDAAWKLSPHIRLVRGGPVTFEADHDFGKLAFVLSSGTAPTPTLAEPMQTEDPETGEIAPRYVDPVWEQEHLVPMLTTVLEQIEPRKGALVLTPSFKDIRAVEPLLRQIAGGRLIVQKRDVKFDSTIAQFRAAVGRGRRPMLICAGGWEGIDMPGMIGDLVIARLPRPPRSDFWQSAYRAASPSTSPAEAERLDLIRIGQITRQKLHQGIGRAIRTASDSATVWIADKRFGISPTTKKNHPDHPAVAAYGDRVEFVNTVPHRFHPALNAARFYDAETGVFSLDAKPKVATTTRPSRSTLREQLNAARG